MTPRPRRRPFLAGMAAALLAGAIPAHTPFAQTTLSQPSPPPGEATALEDLVHEERARAGAPRITRDARLDGVALGVAEKVAAGTLAASAAAREAQRDLVARRVIPMLDATLVAPGVGSPAQALAQWTGGDRVSPIAEPGFEMMGVGVARQPDAPGGHPQRVFVLVLAKPLQAPPDVTPPQRGS